MGKIEHVFIDFDGCLTDDSVYVFEDGREAVKCCRKDGIGLQMLKDLGIGITILSTETNPVVGERAKKLGVDCIQGCEEKERFMFLLGKSGRLDLSKVVYIGNDINDLGAMKLVGYPRAVADAHWEVINYVGTDRTTKAKGGHGAVREACEMICKIIEEVEEIEEVGLIDIAIVEGRK